MEKDSLFPYEKIRKMQEDMLKDVGNAIRTGSNLIAHAPTGLGKTIAAIGPALRYAIDNDKTVFFLTSRHTQHNIAIQTLAEIKRKHGIKFNVTDLIGKKWMCAMPGIELMASKDFAEYCKSSREDDKCEFYSRTKKGSAITADAKKVLSDLKRMEICSTEALVQECKDSKICPYEIAMLLAADSNVIISDYNYIFNKNIRENFFARTKKELENCIIIIDEGHNLPGRIRDLATEMLSSFIMKKAIKEAKTLNFSETVKTLSMIQDILNKYGEGMKIGAEKLIKKDDFVARISRINDYEELVNDLFEICNKIRESQKQSYVGSVAGFLQLWLGPEDGFVRIFSVSQFRNLPLLTLKNRCLDPSVITKDVISGAHSTIVMSGTLTPTDMYKSLLGFPEETVEKEYESPFMEENKLTIVIPETTTKFSMRNDAQFKRIAEITSEIANEVPGNSAIFFPSYDFRDKVYKHFYDMCRKTTFLEQPRMTKEEKTNFIENFKEQEKAGAVLLGVATGSFGEGIDLPGDFLKAVVVVGLPLNQPDLETKELINYFNKKFSKGWDYGYIFPAFNKCLQNAGRCIRSETDRGVVVFLDERYVWPMYRRCFPQDSEIKVSRHYKELIEEFFDPRQKRLF
ncbi:MAG: ATP-dependent DNA helicase [Candidatus Woesearchaeota archaeon]|nr:ATP-dependent DNA helicase [Candidatus Woesearchaeota archaeon]